MEVHPDESRADARLTGDTAADGVAHDLLGLWARVLVETDLQFRRVCHRGDDERRQDCCQPCRPHDQLQPYPIFLQVCYSRLS